MSAQSSYDYAAVPASTNGQQQCQQYTTQSYQSSNGAQQYTTVAGGQQGVAGGQQGYQTNTPSAVGQAPQGQYYASNADATQQWTDPNAISAQQNQQ